MLIRSVAVILVLKYLLNAIIVVKEMEIFGMLIDKPAVYLDQLHLNHAHAIWQETYGTFIKKPAVFTALVHLIHAYATPEETNGTLKQKLAVKLILILKNLREPGILNIRPFDNWVLKSLVFRLIQT